MSQETVMDEVTRVPTHLRNVLSMLENWEALVRNEMDLLKGKAPNSKLAKQICDIAKNSKPIAQEMRAWVGKVNEVVKTMGLDDKLKVSMNLIQELSKGDRYKFYHKLISIEKARTDGGIHMMVVADA